MGIFDSTRPQLRITDGEPVDVTKLSTASLMELIALAKRDGQPPELLLEILVELRRRSPGAQRTSGSHLDELHTKLAEAQDALRKEKDPEKQRRLRESMAMLLIVLQSEESIHAGKVVPQAAVMKELETRLKARKRPRTRG